MPANPRRHTHSPGDEGLDLLQEALPGRNQLQDLLGVVPVLHQPLDLLRQGVVCRSVWGVVNVCSNLLNIKVSRGEGNGDNSVSISLSKGLKILSLKGRFFGKEKKNYILDRFFRGDRFILGAKCRFF